MPEHIWKWQAVETVQDYFWMCEKCGACAGPVLPGKELKPTIQPFLAGTPLGLTWDCEEATKTIDNYLESYPSWRSTYERHKNYPTPLIAPPLKE